MWMEAPSLSRTSCTSSRGYSTGVATESLYARPSADRVVRSRRWCWTAPRRRVTLVATPASGRQVFLDGFRGLALIFMVLNHTGRWWIERPMGWPRYHLVYLTVTLAAPIFLFLAGFCMPLSFLNSTVTRGERYVSVAWKYVRRGAQLVVAGWFLNLLVFPDEPLFAGGVLQTIGLSIIGVTALLPLLGSRAARSVLLAATLGIYTSFALAHPFLRTWVKAHPVLADV